MSLKVGVGLPLLKNFDPSTTIPRVARAVEEIGYDSVWVFERLLVPEDQSGEHGLLGMPDVPWPERYRGVLDPLVGLTLAAAVTERVELGTCVLVAPLHVPAMLARTLASIDAASGGRVVAGLGSGWSIDEFAAFAPRPFAERGAALDEFLDVAAAVWGADPVSFGNERYVLAPAEVGPKPVRPIPIYLGGFTDVALRRAARRADGWLPTGLPPAAAGAMLARLRQMTADAGRDPAAMRCAYQVNISGTAEVPAEGRQPYTGSIDQVVGDLADLAAAGVDHVFLTVANAIGDAGDPEEFIDLAAKYHAAVREAGL
ncbi:TIGR03619 family F420-dependent LLM class oxidoreductase [Dactylosporangium sp. CA-092794]|uniref:TIGR03619 family F420-dependent LLM class oxidoreductase n=1 Tax=Dactylosporangium sp. CA-092794 TaxID=3239929 RepID=UPI003D8A7592